MAHANQCQGAKMLYRKTLIVVSVLLIGCQQGIENDSDTAQVEKTSVRFPIPAVRAPFGVWFSADQNGYFKEEGLEVSFGYGGKTTNPVAMVTAGTDEFGILGGPDTVLVAIGKGAPLVIVAIIHKDSNLPCLITRKESGITKVEELQGKSVGMYTGHISADVLRNLFRKTGVKVKEIDVGYDYSQFISGQVDAQWAFRTAAAAELPEKGVDVNVINTADSGIVTHGYTIFTTKEMVDEHPEKVRKFLKATFKGVVFMAEEPGKTADLVVAQDKTGNLKKDQVLKRIAQYNEVSPRFNPHPPGYFDKEMLQSTYDRLVEENVIGEPYEIESAFTTKFLDEIHAAESAR